MRRSVVAGGGAILLLFGLTAPAADVVSDRRSKYVDEWIPKLADADSSVRTIAYERLRDAGRAMPPAARRALKSPDPQIRLMAERLLLHVPWTREDDNEVAAQVFTGYADLLAPDRCVRIDQLPATLGANGSLPRAADTLIRILRNDPSVTVRWHATATMRVLVRTNPEVADGLASLVAGVVPPTRRPTTRPAPEAQPAVEANGPPVVAPIKLGGADWSSDGGDVVPVAENGPLLAAAAAAQVDVDPDQAAALYRKAIDLDADTPGAVDGSSTFAYEFLLERAERDRRFPEAMDLLRRMSVVDGYAALGIASPSAQSLFAMYARGGPMVGLVDDLRDHQHLLLTPPVMYAMSRVADRAGHPALSTALGAVALSLGGLSSDDHMDAGDFCLRQSWTAEALREFDVAIKLADTDQAALYERMATAAAEMDDDLVAAKYWEAAVKAVTNPGNNGPNVRFNMMAEDNCRTQAHWHRLKAAIKSDDRAEMKVQVDKLLELDEYKNVLSRDPGITAEIVPTLVTLGRTEDADRVFDAAYKTLHAQIDQSPGVGIYRNNLAWVLAKSDRHMDEALKLSAESLQLDPNNTASMDTRAEVLFRDGRPAEAAAEESAALEIKPRDVYMTRQLAKYRKAAGQ